VLLSIGKRENKMKLKNSMHDLHEMGYKIYATYKTHKFLKREGIEAILVQKISEPNMQPNLKDLLDANRFDLIVNIAVEDSHEEHDAKEEADGDVIQKMAVKSGTKLVTSVDVAKELIEKLKESRVTKKK
jgi:AICAR transformylase/IMP cyclohydrolase PurH